MKKLLALILAALMIAAALASCAVAPTASDPHIRLTSSDASDAAAWLDARLGDALIDRVVLGTDADGYAVDVSALEDDGYFIRAFGDEVALFARTTDGLDRAVRKYAKTVEAGETVADETYHEGYRVKRLTVAGEDISAFAVRVEGALRSEDATGLRDRVEQYASPAVSELIKKMCGASLADEADAEHFIIFRPTKESGWGEGTYRYAVENGDLVFEYAELLGAKYAFLTFLGDECGWKNVSAGLDLLAESDGIDIPAGLDVTVEPMLEGLYLHTNAFGLPAHNSAYESCPGYRGLYNKIYRISHACHGMRDYNWGNYNPGGWDQSPSPCLTDDVVINAVIDTVLAYVDEKLASGSAIGYDLNYIDVAHADSDQFCRCRRCLNAYVEEGGIGGVYVRFANAVAEALDDEGWGELKVLMFAYTFHEPPRVTSPRENVWITYCMDDHCIVHPSSGECCQTELPMTNEVVSGSNHARWLRGWAALTDNLYVWNYDLDYNIHPYIIVDQIWDDMHFFADVGVTRMFWQMRYHGLGLAELHMQLAEWLDHHPDAARREYNDEYLSLLELHFGAGWEKVAEAFSLWERAELESASCCSGWNYYMMADPDQMNYKYYTDNCFEPILALFDGAIAEADSAAQVSALELLTACHLYHGCLGLYFCAYETDDGQLMESVESYWAKMLGLLEKNGKDTDNMEGAYVHFPLYESVHDFAWDSDYGWSAAPPRTPTDFEYNRVTLLKQYGLYDDEGEMKPVPSGVEFTVSGRVPE